MLHNINISSNSFFSNLLVSLLPLSFILGNLAINLNVLIIVFFCIFLFIKQGNKRKIELILFDKLVISIGRVPNSKNITSKNLKLEIDSRNFIKVNDRNLTNLDNVYAIGDVVRGPMLAHKASEEGVAVAEIIAGQSPHINFDYVPWVIYTSPEIAWVGKNEKQLKDEGVTYSVGQFPFIVSGRARALGETSGFVKILADKNTDLILGIHIIGPFASELIAEAVLALEFKASSEDIARIIHAHPSLSEALHEAALGVEKRSLHI